MRARRSTWIGVGILFSLVLGLGACGRDGAATPTREPTAETPTPVPTPAGLSADTPTPAHSARGSPAQPSAALIAHALAAGEIEAETALLYQVYAAFGDDRLPAQYVGDDRLVIDTEIMTQVVERWEQLSPEAQTILRPFLRAPAARGSWLELQAAGAWEPAIPWDSLPAVGGLIRVWYQQRYRDTDQATARLLADEMDASIYPLLDDLMGRPLLPDSVCEYSGEDEALDIYLVGDLRVAGVVTPCRRCAQAPSFVILHRATPGLKAILAHELMHVFQNLYNGCSEYAWLKEATATWAMDYVYPVYQAEHRFAPLYLDQPHLPLDTLNGAHEYGAYLFFQYLNIRFLDPYLIQTLWINSEGFASSLEAVDQAIPDGFATTWPAFASANWNEPPVDVHQRWDGLESQARPLGEPVNVVDVAGDGETVVDLPPGGVDHLSLVYQHFRFPSPEVRWVSFFNGFTFTLQETGIDMAVDGVTIRDGSPVYAWREVPASQRQGAFVQALLRLEGDEAWRLEDWTDRPVVSLCRDAASERLEELVLIFGNSAYDPQSQPIQPTGLDTRLRASTLGCWQWEGSARAVYETELVRGTLEARVVLARQTEGAQTAYPALTYQLASGDWTWNTESVSGCTVEGGRSGVLDSGPEGGVLRTFPGVWDGPSQGRYLGTGALSVELPLTLTCPPGVAFDAAGAGPVSLDAWFVASSWTAETDQVLRVASDGVTIEGQVSRPPWTWTWYLEAKRE